MGLTTLVKDTFRTAALACTANVSASAAQTASAIRAIRRTGLLHSTRACFAIREFTEAPARVETDDGAIAALLEVVVAPWAPEMPESETN